ncbi:MAG: DUF4330 domain-containing protein [Defluviitaleaceae bacterium]|nr:DUF4330 domain-containing protein [Defluviitaleaceae bacterium]
MIDRNGKIFGKVNVLDILLIFVVIGGIFFFLTRTQVTIIPGAVPTETYTMRFFTPMVDDFLTEFLNVGDDIVQHGTEISFGNVTDIIIADAIEFRPNQDGILVGSPWDGRVELELESNVVLPAGSLNNGLMIGGNRFAVGQSVTIRVGNSVIFVRISYLGE